MHRPSDHAVRRAARLVAPLAALLTLGAAPAHAQTGHSLSLSGPSSAATGKTTVLQATGVVPSDVMLNRYINVYAIPASVVSTCPDTFQNAMQLAYSSSDDGGDTVANHVPAEGTFSVPIGYSPRAAGAFVLCGYLHEGVETMAKASHTVNVAGGAAKPRRVKAPKVRRSGAKLVCSRGTWAGKPSRYAFAWRVNGRTQRRANRSTLRVTPKLRGRRVQCVVRATNAAGSATARSKAFKVR